MGTTHETHTSHNRFKVVKIESKEPFKRGKWICMDFYDQPSHAETSEDTTTSSTNTGSSTVAIDNKIEQAMDLVKSHLMFAVREEVDVLKEKISELMEKITRLEVENAILRSHASAETIAMLSSKNNQNQHLGLSNNVQCYQQMQQQSQLQQSQQMQHQQAPQQHLPPSSQMASSPRSDQSSTSESPQS